MAIFPQGLSHIDARCNAGERRVLHQLKRCLEDDYLVWHDVPIGPRAYQPDFVILSPRWGVLLIEVKDWKRATLCHATRDSVELDTARGRVTEANPLRKVRDYTMGLVDLMQLDPALVHEQGGFKGKLLFPYGWGVVFSNLRAADVSDSDFGSVFAPGRTLLRDDLDDTVGADLLQQRLWGMFTVHYPHTLSLPQRDRIRWHLFPEVRLEPAQALLGWEEAERPIALPDLMQVMDLQQEQVARSLGEGHRVIHGVAGSGKTMILVFRAQHLAAAARADRPILILCYNRALAGRIEAVLRSRGVDERVQVRTFHSWCEDLVRSYQINVPVERRASDYFDVLARTVARAVDTNLVPAGQYTALLIDEAHDFEEAWLRVAARMVSPETNSLLVLYDDAQSIYQKQRRQFSFSSVGIDARGRTSILKLNYRNTAEVLALAAHCAQHLLRATARDDSPGDDAMQLVPPSSAGRRGPLPVLIQTSSARDEAEWVAERIELALNGGLSLDDCGVLCRTKSLMAPIETALRGRGIAVQSMGSGAFRRFDWHVPSVKLVTLHSAKGLEFACVVVAGLQSMPHPGALLDDELRLLYVGMTRATRELALSACANSGMVERVQESLTAVARQFAAAA
jgi:hypothetical protein